MDIVEIISNVGFPIAMCLLVFYYGNTKYNETIEQLRTTISRLTDVVADNTKALELLEQRLGVREDVTK